MTVLANILPGVRSVRAPLAVGFLWLLAIWLGAEPFIGEPRHATGIYASVVRLRGFASAFGVIALISFVAYIVGSLWMVTVQAGGRLLHRSAEHYAIRFASRRWSLRRAPRGTGTGEAQRVGSIGKVLPEGSERDDLRRHLREQVSAALREAGDHSGSPAEKAVEKVTDTVAGQLVAQDWRWLPQRIVGEFPQLYSEIDRYEAEAEFRGGLIGPIVGVGVVVAVRLSNTVWVSAIVVVIVALLASVLALARTEARTRANMTIAGGIVSNQIKPPSLDPKHILIAYQAYESAQANEEIAEQERRAEEVSDWLEIAAPLVVSAPHEEPRA